METIERLLSEVELGDAIAFENLAIFPLLGGGPEPGYVVLDEALASGAARVTEVSESGSVPELSFDNRGEAPVLLLDGEELVGAKQNRVLNLSILAPAKDRITIPVSCVEAGRWARRSAEFGTSSRAQYADLRARKMTQVSASLRESGSRRSDQNAVWDDISMKMSRMDTRSESSAMSDIYDRHHDGIEAYVSAFRVLPNQVGAVFAIDGEVRGVELFDAASTFERQLAKLVRSYALDALERSRETPRPAEPAQAREALAQVSRASSSCYPAVGLGEDVRLSGERIDGSALLVDGKVVHLCAFVRGSSEGGVPEAR